MAIGSHITREILQSILENKGIRISNEIYDKLWTFLDCGDDGSIHISGFLNYMRHSLDQENQEEPPTPLNNPGFRINSNVFATSILDYVKSAFDAPSAKAFFSSLYEICGEEKTA